MRKLNGKPWRPLLSAVRGRQNLRSPCSGAWGKPDASMRGLCQSLDTGRYYFLGLRVGFDQ